MALTPIMWASRYTCSSRAETWTKASNRQRFTPQSWELQLAVTRKQSVRNRSMPLICTTAIKTTRSSTIWLWRMGLLTWFKVGGSSTDKNFLINSSTTADSYKRTVSIWGLSTRETSRVSRFPLPKFQFLKLRTFNKTTNYLHCSKVILQLYLMVKTK